jgi:hypothetical protein
MCWAFCLFNVGFIVPLVIQGFLGWATRVRQNIPLNAQKWTIILSNIMYISTLSVCAAICILNIAILRLYYVTDPVTGKPKDPGLELNVTQRDRVVRFWCYRCS